MSPCFLETFGTLAVLTTIDNLILNVVTVLYRFVKRKENTQADDAMEGGGQKDLQKRIEPG